MFISGNSTPNFRTINDFRSKILKDSIKTLFAEVVKMLVEMGYVSLDVQYIDGTKIEDPEGFLKIRLSDASENFINIKIS